MARLLASPHFGERMAIGWLDVVRFADTIGYHSDNPRPVWPYRLDLARWLVSRDHPLTARVVMNRLGKQFFGAGLSRVLDDLGTQGEPPLHPELLDWLACEFMDSQWDMQHMVRTIVTSATYRQSAVASAERMAWAWRQVLQRLPRVEELETLMPLYRRHLAAYQADRSAAAQLATVGLAPPPQRARRVIWLTMAGGPSQFETFAGRPSRGAWVTYGLGSEAADLHATMLHQLGIRHDAFTVKFPGLDAKLTGVERARVLTEILA